MHINRFKNYLQKHVITYKSKGFQHVLRKWREILTQILTPHLFRCNIKIRFFDIRRPSNTHAFAK